MEDESLVLSWRDLNLWITPHRKRLMQMRNPTSIQLVLNNISGYAKSGCLLAIMGPSGSGKTTLLTAISRRNLEKMNGDILLNGKQVDKDLMLRISGFVPQNDLAIDNLTVKEHINFMATLKMDKRSSETQRQIITSALLKDLGLEKCTSNLLNTLSGGERKRLSLAVQMLTDPPLLFCDEPTTGLDSYNAGTVINVLRQLASRGKAVTCSIHQPASDIFMLFDHICLLLPGGHLAYHGELSGVQRYFECLGFHFPPLYNPADFILQKLHPSNQSELKKITTGFNKSNAKANLVKELDIISTYDNSHSTIIYGIEGKFLKFYSVQRVSLMTQLHWLTWRTGVSMYRNSQRIILRLALYLLTGILVSSPYTGVTLNQEGIQNIQGFHYIVISETIFCHAYGVMHTFPAEIPILLREMGNGVYKPGPYYLSKIIVLIPRTILETLIFCLVVFWVAQVRGGILGFLLFAAPILASAVTSTAYGFFISTLFENISTASLLSVPIDFVSLTFSGLFLQLSTVPLYIRWIKYMSRFYYGMEAISILQWKEINSIPCSEKEDIPCIENGEEVLEKYGFSSHNLGMDFMAMFLGFCILHFFGFISLQRRSRQRSVY